MRILRFLLGLVLFVFLPVGNLVAASKNVIANLAAGQSPRAVAINAATNRIYVANEFSNDVTVVDGTTNVASTVKVGPRPQYIAVSAATNRIFVSNAGDATLSVIDGATLAVKTLAIGGSGPIAVNERRNQIYVVRLGTADEVTIVDGAKLTWYTAATDSYAPVDLALDEAADKLYVANYATGDVRVVDLTSTSDFPPTVSIGVWSHPTNIALNVGAKRLFVVTEDSRGPISIIDTTTNKGVSLAPAGHALGPRAIVVNPSTNKAYAAFANEVVVIDGNTNALTFLPMPTPVALAVNPATNRIYAPSANGTLTVIDGATHAMSSLSLPTGATSVAVNLTTNRVYVAGGGITVIDGGAPLSGPAPTVPSVNAQGLWWASPPGSESGWGVNLTQQGDVLFGTWFTYDTDGSGLWLVMSNGNRTGTNSYSGTLFRTTGPAFSSTAFDASKVTRTPVGSATFTFTDADNGMMSATVNGITVTKQITRQVFSAPMPTCQADGPQGPLPIYQDLWWKAPAGSESGWGVNIAHQGNILFVTWFTYAADGRGMWLVGSSVEKTGNATYSGVLYRVIGPAYSASPWDPAKVLRTPVGQVGFTFSDANNGTMTYTVDGITQSKPITRQVYASPATICR
jgi:YVTN family beta-propeller protein